MKLFDEKSTRTVENLKNILQIYNDNIISSPTNQRRYKTTKNLLKFKNQKSVYIPLR